MSDYRPVPNSISCSYLPDMVQDSLDLRRIEEYMKSNEELPEPIMEDLQRVIAKPRQELADLDKEINDIERRLILLKDRRGQVKKHLARYDCLLSPIRRLPEDILRNIFHHCLPTRRDPAMSAREAPILLTRTCRAWRQIAYSSPTIWARLYITFSDEDILLNDNEVAYGLTRKYVSYTLQLRCRAVEEWLSRSGACPLSISLSYTSRIWVSNEDQSPGKSDLTLKLFRTLTRFCHRWQRFELKAPLEVYRILEGMLPTSQLSVLKTVRISVFPQLSPVGTDDELAITLLQAPNLKRISMAAIPFQIITTFQNSKHLTSLNPIQTLTVNEAISLLRNCPNLEYIRLILISDYPLSQPLVPSRDTQVSLPHLRVLSIVDTIYSNAIGCRVYECIDAPRLEWLDYVKEPGYAEGDGAYHTAITALLQKSTGLRKLTIEAPMLDTAQLRKVLRSAPNLEHLILGQVRPDDISLRQTFVTPIPAIGSHLWNLGDVFFEDEVEMEYHLGIPILPRLEILEVSEGPSLSLTDETLRDIILHRQDLHASKGIALLKKVGVLFSRSKDTDILKDLVAHSHDAGRVELDLTYLDRPRPHTVHFVYSGFAIDDLDRTWQFRDIEEEWDI